MFQQCSKSRSSPQQKAETSPRRKQNSVASPEHVSTSLFPSRLPGLSSLRCRLRAGRGGRVPGTGGVGPGPSRPRLRTDAGLGKLRKRQPPRDAFLTTTVAHMEKPFAAASPRALPPGTHVWRPWLQGHTSPERGRKRRARSGSISAGGWKLNGFEMCMLRNDFGGKHTHLILRL